MDKYKIGDMVELKKGDRAIIVDFENDEALIFNLAKMNPGKIKVKDIQKKISEPNCKIVVEKKEQTIEDANEEIMNLTKEKEDAEDLNDRLADKIFESRDELVEALTNENNFIKEIVRFFMKK